MKRALIVPLLACLVFAPRASAERSIASRGGPVRVARPPIASIVAGSLLVRGTKPNVPGAHRVAVLADGTERWDFEGATAEETLARAEALAHDRPDLQVDLDLWRTAQAEPNDEGYPRQWPLKLLNAKNAWATTTGDPSLTVAVVDTGYVDHPDLVDRIAPGYDFISDPALAGDGDGRDGDPHDAGDESEASSSFHGSHIAGIIGATTNNSLGMAGVDWSCRLQPVRVLGVKAHRGKDSDIADGIRWAAGYNVPGVPQNKTPARVINLSFGGPGFSRVLQDAVLAALDRGVLVVGSAGNDGGDAHDNVPGALEGVLSVAAADPDGNIASYSNYGPRVDVMTPGGALFLDAPISSETPTAIWSTSWVRSGEQPVFAYAAGTSQAAAYATGVAALVRAAAPSLPPEVVAAVMRRASTVGPDACPMGCGAGLVDVGKAVHYARQIEEATCGPTGCGKTNALAPVPLRPEEGCSSSSRAPNGLGIALFCAAIVVFRRRALSSSLMVLSVLGAASCGAPNADQELSSQSSEPLIVKIVDPVPTFGDGALTIPIGEGRTITAEVTPPGGIDRVEIRIGETDELIGRLGHAPWRFAIPKWAVGGEGGHTLCVTATDVRAQQGEVCFRALP
ncbi:MAG: S8 family serine peptidase [Polyangiales bacterium]